jgi:hypothetical protein
VPEDPGENAEALLSLFLGCHVDIDGIALGPLALSGYGQPDELPSAVKRFQFYRLAFQYLGWDLGLPVGVFVYRVDVAAGRDDVLGERFADDFRPIEAEHFSERRVDAPGDRRFAFAFDLHDGVRNVVEEGVESVVFDLFAFCGSDADKKTAERSHDYRIGGDDTWSEFVLEVLLDSDYKKEKHRNERSARQHPRHDRAEIFRLQLGSVEVDAADYDGGRQSD